MYPYSVEICKLRPKFICEYNVVSVPKLIKSGIPRKMYSSQDANGSCLGLTISRSIFISREREFPKHFGYFPGISRELKTYLIANRKYPIFERKCIFWGSRIILSFVTIIFDSKVWFWAQRKTSKIEWNRKICQSQYIKISRNFPGNRKNSRDQAGLKIFGKFPGFPGREFPGTSPRF